MPVVDTSQLTKHFGEITAVDAVDLTVTEGEVYGFLGPNGAGKSTTINLLLNYVTPTAGTGSVLGYDIESESLAIRRNTGVLPEDFGVYDRLSARKHVDFAIETKAADDDPVAVLERVGLGDAVDRKAGGFSTGMKQRLALGMALVGEPDLLILDEPSSGLDPNGAREMRSIITEEIDRGATVFFSSHIMEQVEAVCDRVGIMVDGRIIEEGDIDTLKDGFAAESRLVVSVDSITEDLTSAVESIDSVTGVSVDGTDVAVMLQDSRQKTAVIDAIEGTGVGVTDITSAEASLEDLFVELTGKPADDTEKVEARS